MTRRYSKARFAPTISAVLGIAGAAVVLLHPSSGFAEERLVLNPFTHVVHLRADVTVDGELVRFDEYVECRASGGTSNNPLIRLAAQRKFIARKLSDGGAIVLLFDPRLCLHGVRTWAPQIKRIPSRAFSARWTVPSWYRPRLYRVDSIETPRRIGVVISDAYYAQKDAAIQLSGFRVELAPFPPPDAIVRQARRQARAELNIARFSHRCRIGSSDKCWSAFSLVGVRKSELMSNPIAAKYLKQLKRSIEPVRPPFPAQRAIRILTMRSVSWYILHDLDQEPGKKFTLSRRWGWPTKRYSQRAAVVPVRCSGDVCTADPAIRGYAVFYWRQQTPGVFGHKEVAYRAKWLVFRGKRISLRNLALNEFLHDPVGGAIYRVGYYSF